MKRIVLSAAFVVGLTGLAASSAHALCESPSKDAPLLTGEITSGNPSPPSPHPDLGVTVVADSTTLKVLDTSTFEDTCKDTPLILTGAVQNNPGIVRLSDSTDYAVFVASDDGVVSRVDPVGCAVDWSVDLKRSTCGADSLVAMPAVHLRRYASSTFQGEYTTDVVYVGTRYTSDTSCPTGHNTDNRIYALRATDGAILWTFNELGDVDMDIVSQGAYIDYVNDMIYVGTDRTASSSQASVWAISVIDGTLAWSQNVGRMQTTPMVNTKYGKLYVGTRTGEVKALNLEDGTIIWSVRVGMTAITSNIFSEFREPYNNLIGAVGSDGQVRVVRDDGTSGTEIWEVRPNSVNASSRLMFDGYAGKVYVGAVDGKIYQMDVTDGTVEASRAVHTDTAATVGDPSFFWDGSDVQLVASAVNTELGTKPTTVAKFCIPWSTEASPIVGGETSASLGGAPKTECTDHDTCAYLSGPCSAGLCLSNVCARWPAANGDGCDDKNEATTGDVCYAGTCSGKTECQTRFDVCACDDGDVDEEGNPVDYVRVIATRDVDMEKGEGTEWVHPVLTSSCLTIGSNVRSVISIHLFDERRRPFTGASVTFDIQGSGPLWFEPLKPSVKVEDPATLANRGVVEAARPGTYYAMLGAPASGQFAEPVNILITVKVGSCVNTTFTATVELKQPVGTGSGALGGCNLVGERGSSGYLRVKVRRGDTGELLSEAPVMVGYGKKPASFYTTYARFISPSPLPADASNIKATDANGVAEFVDYGNTLNGPYVVTAGHAPIYDAATHRTIEFAKVTKMAMGAQEVSIVLPVARITGGEPTTARYTNGLVSGRRSEGDGESTRMALMAQRRPLSFFAGMRPVDLFDAGVCTATSKFFVGENAYLSTIADKEEHLWDKTFQKRDNDTLQTSYHAVITGRAFPNRVFNMRGYLETASFEQLGFLFNHSITEDWLGPFPREPDQNPEVVLGDAGPWQTLVTVSFGSAAPPETDVVGLALTDYSSSTNGGRGAGDLFLQSHAFLKAADVTAGGAGAKAELTVFDLDNYSDGMDDKTWNIAQLNALYVMSPACVFGTHDPRCDTVPETMQNARSTVFARVNENGGRCDEPWHPDQEEPLSQAQAPAFLELVDLGHYSPEGNGLYEVCAGGDYDYQGRCCQGNLEQQGGICYGPGEAQAGDFMKHTLYFKRSVYPPASCIGGVRYPTIERYPYWVFYTPGDAARIHTPDIPSEFEYACGCASQADCDSCDSLQRSGLPRRSMIGNECAASTDCKSPERCRLLNGTGRCVLIDEATGDYIIEEYEWRADLFTVGLVGSVCQSKVVTSCTEYAKPTTAPDAFMFDGSFDLSQTNACLTAQSTNSQVVN